MLKVNLEKEIIRQNKSVVSARDLLYVKEYDRLGDDDSEGVLQRVFGRTAAVLGKQIKEGAEYSFSETKNFNQERVFHISQIEKLCKKYHLRFLSSMRFNGSIDKDLAGKISQFEIAYNIECKHQSTYIAAPASSFDLEPRPKDPLMFYKINSDYYYLIHKWGSDLSIIRRLYRFLSNWVVTWLFLFIPAVSLSIYFSILDNGSKNMTGYGISGVILMALCFVGTIVQMVFGSSGLRLIKQNRWRSDDL